MAETRLDFRRRGYILVPKDSSEDATACAGKRDSAARLQRQVERDYAARGQETHVWATPEDVAQHGKYLYIYICLFACQSLLTSPGL